MNALYVVFVLTLLLIHTYFIYPFILWALIYVKNKREGKRQVLNTAFSSKPSVTLVIAAFNEEKVIEDKIKNCLSLNYNNCSINILIVSDGSIDETNSIVKKYLNRFSNIKLIELERGGKPRAIDIAVRYSNADLILFTDANTMLEKDVINILIDCFDDEEVGCVSGRLVYRNPKNLLSGKGEGFYWRYENTLKILESKLGYVAGANGAIYMIRRELMPELPYNIINDDFFISMGIVQQGYKSLYAHNAIAYEDVAPSEGDEFRRHIRDAVGHYRVIVKLWRLINPLRGISWFIYVSHRLLRWFAPFFLIILFALSALNKDSEYIKIFFALQIMFYAAALFGFAAQIAKMRIVTILYMPYYFCNLNLALLLGFFKAISNTQKATWRSTPR